MFVDVDLSRADYQRTLEGDPGFHEIEANRLKTTGDERIRVERYNEITLAGGAAGSRFKAVTFHEISLKVE